MPANVVGVGTLERSVASALAMANQNIQNSLPQGTASSRLVWL